MVLPNSEVIIKPTYGSINIVERVEADTLLKKADYYISQYQILTDRGFRDIKRISRGSEWCGSKLKLQMPGGERGFVVIASGAEVYDYETQKPLMESQLKKDSCIVMLQDLKFTCRGLEIKNNVGTVISVESRDLRYSRTVNIEYEGEYLCLDRVYQIPYKRGLVCQ